MSKVLTGMTIGLAVAALAAPLAQADVSSPDPMKSSSVRPNPMKSSSVRPHPWKVGDVSRPHPWRSLRIHGVQRMDPWASRDRIGY